MRIRPAQPSDLDVIKTLLARNGLPDADIASPLLANFLVAADADGMVIGCVGFERFGGNALLRSLAVISTARGTGVGKALLHQAEELIDRSEAPSELQLSKQFKQLCPASAVCMRKLLL